MSWSPGNTTKAAENRLAGATEQAQNVLWPAAFGTGTKELGAGADTVQSGTNWLQTILGGNQANTTAALQSSIDQIRSGTSGTLNAINTLMPRGGGRYGALFGQALAPQSQVQNLFNTARTTAAAALPQIGLQRMGVGTNLFNIGNSALGNAGNMSANLARLGQVDTARSDAINAAIGQAVFGLATTPFGAANKNLFQRV